MVSNLEECHSDVRVEVDESGEQEKIEMPASSGVDNSLASRASSPISHLAPCVLLLINHLAVRETQRLLATAVSAFLSITIPAPNIRFIFQRTELAMISVGERHRTAALRSHGDRTHELRQRRRSGSCR